MTTEAEYTGVLTVFSYRAMHSFGETMQLVIAKYTIIYHISLPELAVFSDANTTAEEVSEGMWWIEDSGMSVSVLVSQVDSVSLVQLSRYRGSKASVLEPPQPMILPEMMDITEALTSDTYSKALVLYYFILKYC